VIDFLNLGKEEKSTSAGSEFQTLTLLSVKKLRRFGLSHVVSCSNISYVQTMLQLVVLSSVTLDIRWSIVIEWMTSNNLAAFVEHVQIMRGHCRHNFFLFYFYTVVDQLCARKKVIQFQCGSIIP